MRICAASVLAVSRVDVERRFGAGGRQTWKALEGLSRRWFSALAVRGLQRLRPDTGPFRAGQSGAGAAAAVATEGIHSPLETACISDIEALAKAEPPMPGRDAAAEIIASVSLAMSD
jgi:hypothetical protein